MRLTVVTGSFAADHHRPYGDRRHGHDWHVEARVRATGHKGDSQAKLDAVLGRLDHGFLDDLLEDPSNEGVAEWIAGQLDAEEVWVWRYDRGRKFGGGWRP